MRRNLSLILGGAGSGKSHFAESLIAQEKSVLYIATTDPSRLHLDSEMQARIEAHRKRRPAHWHTHTEPYHLPQYLHTIATKAPCILIDSLTLWLANSLERGNDPHTLSTELITALQQQQGRTLIVSHDVSSGIIPTNAVARHFVYASGTLHQHIAAIAHNVIYVTAGIPSWLKGNPKLKKTTTAETRQSQQHNE
ncbi:MAG: bifunctional adenosylcobinamide kinase/adenosylcobinamide-phosphate guanylyltransferase [Alphaproteobacteria bacterium GM202ARS2]|nr:bifunctional adenosylcobinamide kinase/adenosylcobinamide-phosphate guanylyltransferase [Alphaproteobacteria bacterium GM202ARS2]